MSYCQGNWNGVVLEIVSDPEFYKSSEKKLLYHTRRNQENMMKSCPEERYLHVFQECTRPELLTTHQNRQYFKSIRTTNERTPLTNT